MITGQHAPQPGLLAAPDQRSDLFDLPAVIFEDSSLGYPEGSEPVVQRIDCREMLFAAGFQSKGMKQPGSLASLDIFKTLNAREIGSSYSRGQMKQFSVPVIKVA
jgi:hypothetical protein